VPKEYNFRGTPAALRVARRFAGLDVLNLANNHTGDYGVRAMLDTIRNVRRLGMAPVGAGSDLSHARRPRVVRRLGLRIAFVGFSTILPASFWAGRDRPGTTFASEENVRAGVRAARRRADVVIATFHWGIERSTRPDGIQLNLTDAALDAGATAVIGAHPHVLQPIRRFGNRLVAYSLGNFVFTTGSALTSRTGILKLRLSARGVERAHLRPARIVSGQPRLR
jgi:poly-gamma-glutamate synthesis protein (capsule biosynthesis protein)